MPPPASSVVQMVIHLVNTSIIKYHMPLTVVVKLFDCNIKNRSNFKHIHMFSICSEFLFVVAFYSICITIVMYVVGFASF